MSLREAPDDWRCCSMHDPSGRRGIWFKTDGVDLVADDIGCGMLQTETVNQIEICAGREGDDAEVTLRAGQTLTKTDVLALLGCLEVGAWMHEENEPVAACQRHGCPYCGMVGGHELTCPVVRQAVPNAAS